MPAAMLDNICPCASYTVCVRDYVSLLSAATPARVDWPDALACKTLGWMSGAVGLPCTSIQSSGLQGLQQICFSHLVADILASNLGFSPGVSPGCMTLISNHNCVWQLRSW